MKRFSQRHAAAGDPQLAVYAFVITGSAICLFGRFEHDELDILRGFLKNNRFRMAFVWISAAT
jgi:hypothetical protein